MLVTARFDLHLDLHLDLHPQNSTCRECAEHLRDSVKIEPFFRFICFIMKKIITLETTKKNNLLLNGSHR